MQGFPVSSSGSRTVIGDSLGSRTQLYSLVALAAVLLTLLFLRPVLAAFPTAALGAIVVYAATRLVDVAEFRRIARFRRSELLLALATTVAVLVLDVLYGVLVAIGLSILDLLRRVARPHDGILGYVPGVAGHARHRRLPGRATGAGTGGLPLRLAAVLRQRRGLQAPGAGLARPRRAPVEWFLLNAEANVQVDITAIDALEELRQELAERGIVFAMARVKQELRDDLRSRRLRRAGRRGPHLHDPADGGAGVRRLVRRPPRVDASGADPSAAVNSGHF